MSASPTNAIVLSMCSCYLPVKYLHTWIIFASRP